MTRVYNFSAGPACLPEWVLKKAASEMLDAHNSGMSVMEMSHRSSEFLMNMKFYSYKEVLLYNLL